MNDDDCPVTTKQFAELLDMMKRVVEASTESARRIETLEHQAVAQNKLNGNLASIIEKLVDGMEDRKGSKLIM